MSQLALVVLVWMVNQQHHVASGALERGVGGQDALELAHHLGHELCTFLRRRFLVRPHRMWGGWEDLLRQYLHQERAKVLDSRANFATRKVCVHEEGGEALYFYQSGHQNFDSEGRTASRSHTLGSARTTRCDCHHPHLVSRESGPRPYEVAWSLLSRPSDGDDGRR